MITALITYICILHVYKMIIFLFFSFHIICSHFSLLKWNINEFCLKGKSIYSSRVVLPLNTLMVKLWKRQQTQSSPPTIEDVACGAAASTILSTE